MAKKSCLVCHKILWMAKVEGTAESATTTKRKVPLPYPSDELPGIVTQLSKVILGKMSFSEATEYSEETEFFQRITEISGALKVKEQTKAEKKSIIQKYLEKYQKELESRDPLKPPIYLITSPQLKVVRIQTDSGLPMQSAARCPIMITFWVSKYEGPDSGPKIVLAEGRDTPKQLTLAQHGRLMSAVVSRHSPSPDILATIHSKFARDTGTEDIKIQLVGAGALKLEEREEEDKEKGCSPENKVGREIMTTGLLRSVAGPSECSPEAKRPDSGTVSPKDIEAKRKREEFIARRLMFSSSRALNRPRKKIAAAEERIVSCIFKAKDDVRQDTLSLQIIKLFQDIFRKTNLDLYLYPYSTVSNRTGEVRTWNSNRV